MLQTLSQHPVLSPRNTERTNVGKVDKECLTKLWSHGEQLKGSLDGVYDETTQRAERPRVRIDMDKTDDVNLFVVIVTTMPK